MGGSKSEEFLATAENGEDTYVRCTHLRLRRQRRGRRRCAPPEPGAVRRRARRPRRADPGHAHHRRRWSTTSTTKFPREDRPWDAGDTLKNVLVVLKHPDGTREPIAIGLPGDREVDEKRLEGQLEPTEVEPFDEADFAQAPLAGQGLHRPRRAGGEERVRHPLPRRPARRRGHPLGHRRRRRRQPRARPGRRPRLHPRRHHRGRRGPRRRPLPRAATATAPCETARGIEMGHIFQLGRKYADALGLQVLDENGKLVTVTMGSYGIGVSRAVAAIAENTHDELGLVWPREVAPADVHLVATGKDAAVFDAAGRAGRRARPRRASTVLYDDRRQGLAPA